jgi:hypothetical protein
MAEKVNNVLPLLITTFVVLLIGLVVVQIVAENVLDRTTKDLYTQNIDFTAARDAGDAAVIVETTKFMSPNWTGSGFYSTSGRWKLDSSECLLGSANGFAMKNSSGFVLTSGDDYVVVDETATTRGYFTLKNTDNINGTRPNSTTLVYSGCQSGYITTGWARTMLNLVPGFFAIAIFAAGLLIVFFILREQGFSF